MIPLGDSTVILPHVQGRAVKSGGFSLTLLQTSPQLSAVCVASPLHSTPSPVLQRLNSRSKRRIRSVSSLCRETKVQGEQELSKRRSQGDLGIESKDVSAMSPQQISYPNCLITITSEKELMSSSVETKKDQSADTSSNSSSQEDSRASSLSESKNIPIAKTKKALPRTSKSSNKDKSRKSSKSRKSCKRRNSNKCSSKVPSVFERLTNSTFRNENHSDKEKSKQLPISKKDATIFCNNQPCGTLLEIKRLQATYNPKQNTKPKTFLLLPKVPKFTYTKKDSPRTVAKPEHEKTKLNSCNSTLISPRQKLLDMDIINNKQNIVSCKKIYLSEMQSKAIGGVPSAPPGTPSPDQLKKVEYIPSLMDVKSQRAVKSKLEKLVHKLRIEEQQRKENSIKQDQKKLKESLIQLKQRQRLEIYALNKVMTELENENFKNFMEKKEAVSLGV